MIKIERSIHINNKCQSVFDFAGDYRNDIKWRGNVKEMTLLASGKIRTGIKTRELIKFMGKKYMTIAEITDFKYGKKTSFEGENNNLFVRGSREFHPHENGTIFRYSLQLTPKGFSKIFSPVLSKAFERQVQRDLNNLKKLLEN